MNYNFSVLYPQTYSSLFQCSVVYRPRSLETLYIARVLPEPTAQDLHSTDPSPSILKSPRYRSACGPYNLAGVISCEEVTRIDSSLVNGDGVGFRVLGF